MTAQHTKHAKHTKRKRRRRSPLRILIILILVIAVLVGLTLSTVHKKLGKISTKSLDHSQLVTVNKDSNMTDIKFVQVLLDGLRSMDSVVILPSEAESSMTCIILRIGLWDLISRYYFLHSLRDLSIKMHIKQQEKDGVFHPFFCTNLTI